MILRGIDLKSARLHVHNHHRKKYGCTCGKCGITITISRRRDGPMEMLSGWSCFLQADAYSGYDPFIHNGAGRMIEVSCWAHARRYFQQAMSSEADHCKKVLS
ncbi:MAG UNVERIFIED_CONTAM: IS66 family transposase [Planctomycetaceae bacterium]